MLAAETSARTVAFKQSRAVSTHNCRLSTQSSQGHGLLLRGLQCPAQIREVDDGAPARQTAPGKRKQLTALTCASYMYYNLHTRWGKAKTLCLHIQLA